MFDVAQKLQFRIHIGDGDVGYGIARHIGYNGGRAALLLAPRRGLSNAIDENSTVIISFGRKELVDKLIDFLKEIRDEIPD